jgi:hypothetical protein
VRPSSATVAGGELAINRINAARAMRANSCGQPGLKIITQVEIVRAYVGAPSWRRFAARQHIRGGVVLARIPDDSEIADLPGELTDLCMVAAQGGIRNLIDAVDLVDDQLAVAGDSQPNIVLRSSSVSVGAKLGSRSIL